MSIPAAFLKSNHPIFRVLLSATSSPGSVDGALHSNSQTGQKTDLSGPQAFLANHSALRGSNSGPMMSVTYGQYSMNSSDSAALSTSLGSRLQTLLPKDGSMEYRQTWRLRDTPAGRPYWAHTAQADRTPVKDSSGSPKKLKRESIEMRMMSSCAADATKNPSEANVLANTEKCSAKIATNGLTHFSMTSQMMDANGAEVVGWSTPCMNEDAAGSLKGNMQQMFSHQVRGMILSCEDLSEEDYAALRVLIAQWLMGFPPSWAYCGAMAMPLSRRSPHRSSAHSLKSHKNTQHDPISLLRRI